MPTSLERAINAPIAVLEKWLGYGEKNTKNEDLYSMKTLGHDNWTFIGKYFDDEYKKGNKFYDGYGYSHCAWCDMTVDYAMCQAFGMDLGRQVIYQPWKSHGAGCYMSASYFKKNNAWVASNGTPRRGDQIFFYVNGGINHTGIVTSVSSSSVSTIEGNTSDRILRRTYNRYSKTIAGYGRPNYALVQNKFSDEDAENIESATPQEENVINTALNQAYQSLQTALQNLASTNNSTVQTVYTAPSRLEQARTNGDTSWFTLFEINYNNLLYNYQLSQEKILSLCYYMLDNDLSQLPDSNISFIINNEILPPKEIGSKATKFLWEKMFDLEYSQESKEYLAECKEKITSKAVVYDEICYQGYQDAVNYYNSIRENYKDSFNNAVLNNSILDAWSVNFQLLQIDIYLLYLKVFGEITRSLKADVDAEKTTLTIDDYNYTKSGVSYNFGEANQDYINFIKNAKTYSTIFSTNLYLPADYINMLILLLIDEINRMRLINKQYQEDMDFIFNQINFAEQEYYDALETFRNEVRSYNLDGSIQSLGNVIAVDWRELIYQMARDYFDYYQNPKYDYQSLLQERNSAILKDDGTTGYEIFYTDVLGFWRQLYYNPLLEENTYDINDASAGMLTVDDFNSETYWLKMIQTQPSSLNFWFDLTEGYDELAKYRISLIGDRLKATKDGQVKSLYYKDTPNIIYYEAEEIPRVENNGVNSYTYFQIGGPLKDAYTLSAQGKTAIDLLQDWLYKFAYCVENISITCLPVYLLKPNYRILVKSQIPGLSGEYIVSRFTIPFIYNGTMQITATKAVPYIGING